MSNKEKDNQEDKKMNLENNKDAKKKDSKKENLENNKDAKKKDSKKENLEDNKDAKKKDSKKENLENNKDAEKKDEEDDEKHKTLKLFFNIISTGKNAIIATVLACATLIGVVIGGLYMVYKNSTDLGDGQLVDANLDGSAQDYVGDQNENKNKNSSVINVKGFGELAFAANQSKQRVNFVNPSNNNCYMAFTLYMPDGTKIYESKLVEPGKAIYEININRKLEPGTYEKAKLHCSCYSMDGRLTTLNGADVKFDLKVE